jgi:hypothetical protein
MSHYLQNHRPWLRLGLRVLLGASAGPATAASALAALSYCGMRFEAAAQHWQVVVVTAAFAVFGASLAWPQRRRVLASAGQYAATPRRSRPPVELVACAAAFGLLCLWLGAGFRPPTLEPAEFAGVVRTAPAFAAAGAAAPSKPLLNVVWLDGPGREARETPFYARNAEAETALPPGGRAFSPVPDDAPGGLRWLGLGEFLWPLGEPAMALPVTKLAPDLAIRLQGRVGPHRLGEPGEPCFSLEQLVLKTKPGPFPDRPTAVGEPGYKPLSAEMALFAGKPLVLFQWGAHPALAKANEPPPGVGWYPLLVTTQDAMPEADQHKMLSVFVQQPVLSVTFDGGLPSWRVIGALDTLGESGLAQGMGYLDGAARTWQARRFNAAAGFLVPTNPQPRQPSTAPALIRQRCLPAVTMAAEPRAPRDHYFPVNSAVGAATFLGMALSCWLWRRAA